MKRLLIILVAMLAGCSVAPQSTLTTSGATMQIDVMVNFGDCILYRFTDVGSHHYITWCHAGTVAMESSR
jgi:hypothetical protein